MQTPSPTDRLTIEVSPAEVQLIVKALGNLPFRDVYPLIHRLLDTISRQTDELTPNTQTPT